MRNLSLHVLLVWRVSLRLHPLCSPPQILRKTWRFLHLWSSHPVQCQQWSPAVQIVKLKWHLITSVRSQTVRLFLRNQWYLQVCQILPHQGHPRGLQEDVFSLRNLWKKQKWMDIQEWNAVFVLAWVVRPPWFCLGLSAHLVASQPLIIDLDIVPVNCLPGCRLDTFSPRVLN